MRVELKGKKFDGEGSKDGHLFSGYFAEELSFLDLGRFEATDKPLGAVDPTGETSSFGDEGPPEDDGGHEPIVVVGPEDSGGGSGGGGGGGGGGASGGGDPGGGSGNDIVVWAARDRLTAAEEATVDAKIKESKAAMAAMPNYLTVEYSATVWQATDGEIVVTAPYTDGLPDSVGVQVPPGVIDYRQIIAVVHNHPLGTMYASDGTFDQQRFEASLRPSEHAGGDRDIMQSIIAGNDGPGPAGGNPNALRFYIIGPDNIIRQYDYGSPLGVTSSDVIL